MNAKEEKVKKVLEQCRRRIIKITGNNVSIALYGYKTKDGNLSFEEISSIVCAVMNVSFSRIIRKCRKRELVTTRNLIFFYARLHTTLSHQSIAERLGLNNHTSGITAIKKVRHFIRAKDDLIINSMRSIEQMLNYNND